MVVMKTGTDKNWQLMKHRFIHFSFCICLAAVLSLPLACSREERPEAAGEPVTVSQVRMDIAIDHWDAPTKADAANTWPDGAIVFVQLTNGKQSLPIEVRRDNANDKWNIYRMEPTSEGGWTYLDLDLTGFSGGHSNYFEGDNGANGQYFNRNADGKINMVDARAAIYYDEDAIFSIVDGVLDLKIHLEPMTGRIRMDPVPDGDSYYCPGFYGILHYTALDRNTFEMEASSSYFQFYYDSNDVIPYVYGRFADPERRTLTIVDGKWGNPAAYERAFSDDILAPGRSNRAYMPVDNHHNEWYRYDGSIDGWNFNVEGLNMYYVVPGTFQMGGEDAQPVHTVTLTRGFYLCQTEITKDMWYRVMGEPSDYANAAVPVTGKSWDEVQAFIRALNVRTGYTFRLPTEAEWEFAARGGMKSNGYTYSGSNEYAEVAVQDGSWSMQAVKTKKTNELNFYDMSGNASEWVYDWYAAYPTGTVVDPRGPDSGEVHVRRGGNRGQDQRYLTVTYRDLDSDLSLTGFRLALDAPRIQ